MIRPTFLGFETAKRALGVAQAGLDIVGHNISNAQTAGYTRQRVDQVSMSMNGMSSRYATFGAATYGSGSLFQGVSQLRDPYLDNRYRAEAAVSGELGVKQDGLTDINNIFDEVMTDGLSVKMDDLLNTIRVLGQSANVEEHAGIVRDAANQLVGILNKNAQQLEDARVNQKLDLQNTVEQDVNVILGKIANLNKQIKDDNFHGDPSNELNDERNLLIDKLSEYLDIKVVRTPTKVSSDLTIETVSIELNNSGDPPSKLVDGSFYNKLGVSEDPDNGNAIVSLLDGISGLPIVDDISSNIQKGGIKGYLDIINGGGPKSESGSTYRGIPYYMASLDEYAQQLAEVMNRVNNISQQESDLSGANYTPVLSGSATDWLDSIEYGTIDFGGKNTNMSFAYDGVNITATYTDENDVVQSYVSPYVPGSKIDFSDGSGGIAFSLNTKATTPPMPTAEAPTTEVLIDAGWPPVPSTDGNKNLIVPLIPGVTDNTTGEQPTWINTISGGVIQFSQKEYNITFNYDAAGFDPTGSGTPDPSKTMSATMTDVNGNPVLDANGNPVTYYGTYTQNGKVEFRDENGAMMFSVKTTLDTPPASTATTVDATINAKNISISPNWFDNSLYITTSKSNAPDKKQASLELDGTKNPTWLDSISMGKDAVAVPNGSYQFAVDKTKTPPEISVKINGIVYKGEYKSNSSIDLVGGTPEKVGITLTTNSKSLGVTDAENVMTVRNNTGAKNDNINKLLTEMNASHNYEVSGIRGSLKGFLTSFQTQMGADKDMNTADLEASVTTMSAFADRRDAISAVSIDEEGINMMTYQNYYNAAARLMTTLDEALDKIINGMGTVGR